jgi:hypothetical protein
MGVSISCTHTLTCLLHGAESLLRS